MASNTMKAPSEITSLLSNVKSSEHNTNAPQQDSEQNDCDVPVENSAIAAEELTQWQWFVIIGSGYLGIILAALDGTMVATLTASISSSYDSLNLLAWLAASYFIAVSVLQPIAGKLTDIYGRRAGLILCNMLFCFGNLISGLANGESMIILGRVVAGLGGGGLNAIPLFVTNDLVPLRRRGMWQGFNNICYGIGSGLGGIFGGWINDTLGWRWAFLTLVPLTIVSGILVALFLKMPTKIVKESELEEKWKRIDFKGSFTLVAAIVLLSVGLNSGGNTVPWTHPIVLISLPLSIILFLLFGYIEAKVAIEPVIPIRLVSRRTVWAACLTSWFFSMSQHALTLYSPIYFQVRNMSATQAGLLLIPTSVGAALGGIGCGYIMRQTGKYYILNIIIQIMFLLPLGLTIGLTLNSSIWYPIIYFFFTGFAYAGKLTVTVTALIAATEQKHQAVITSASYAFRGTGSTIGVSVCSLVFQNLLSNKLWDTFGHMDGGVDLVERLRNSLSEIFRLPTAELQRQAQQVYMDSLNGVFATIFGIATLGTVASLFMKEHTLHKDLARRRA